MASTVEGNDAQQQLELVSDSLCFDCHVRQYRHRSSALNGLVATFSIVLPPSAATAAAADGGGSVPVLYWLSGLTCTDQNFIQKAGACRAVRQHGVAIVVPDTSPRGANAPGEDDSFDFGTGAGFYLNATTDGYKQHYRMYDYVVHELPALVEANFRALSREARSIFGHSMGGHGALVCALRNPRRYRSVSAFAPIAHPSQCAWGKRAFVGYLGSVARGAAEYDATELVRRDAERLRRECAFDCILVEQGEADDFYAQGQLLPEHFEAAARESGLRVQLRMRRGYDHSYFFIATFIDEHVAFHAARLRAAPSS